MIYLGGNENARCDERADGSSCSVTCEVMINKHSALHHTGLIPQPEAPDIRLVLKNWMIFLFSILLLN